MDNLNIEVKQEFGMKISKKKTKVMCISKDRKTKVTIYYQGQTLEHVEQFRYLSRLICEDRYCEKDIQSRI